MSIFDGTAPLFGAFLKFAKDASSATGGVPDNARFIARNFLNEERLEASRAASYAAYVEGAAPLDLGRWDRAHTRYLEEHIFVTPPPTHDYSSVELEDPDVCPETFRSTLALTAFKDTDFDTALIRVVQVSDLAYLSGEREEHIFSLGEEFIADSKKDASAHLALSQIIEKAYSDDHRPCQHRPVFAAFYEDFLDELRDPADTSWPNRLRDRLGLYHISQLSAPGLPRRVFLFKYPVLNLPHQPLNARERPIAIPVVIDHNLSVAFCPAPRELNRGRLLNLTADAEEMPAREVLHPFMPMSIDYLFRVGMVTTPVPDDLSLARRDHLIWLGLLAERTEYGAETDADLFAL